ncbi:MAG: hypothetical protein ACI9OJ_003683, partial [Myxococcota bacterium]
SNEGTNTLSGTLTFQGDLLNPSSFTLSKVEVTQPR